MSETTAPVEENAGSDISEDSYEKYFESEGEAAPEESESEIQAEEQSEPQSESESEEVDETKKAATNEQVPLSSFIKEKQRRKEMSKKMERMEEAFQQVLGRIEQKNQPAPPSYEEDPIGSLAHNQQAIQQQVLLQQQEIQNRNQQDQNRQVLENLVGQYHTSANEFQKQHQDFGDAYKFLVDSKLGEYTTIGMSPNDARMRLQSEELGVVQMAMEEGKNPAELIYSLARSRGFAPATQEDMTSKLKTIEKGMKSNKSLSNTGGKTKSNVTLEQLADMDSDDPDFDRYWSELIG